MSNLIHTCYRITDIDRSTEFYKALGFEETGRIPIRDEAVNVFMNLPGDGDMPRLELTYNFGVDSYDIGTAYGHIAITADDLDGALERLKAQGIEPEKPPYTVREGGSRLCFVRDPDGYRLEIIEKPSSGQTGASATSEPDPEAFETKADAFRAGIEYGRRQTQ
jgi:lactoylglutathione lyase